MSKHNTKVPSAGVASPVAAGFRPAGAVIAIAAAFVASPEGAQAQPSGAQAIHGQASLSQQGSKLLVTTQNGAGTNHSAINWQSFSVPGGSTTHFQQPTAASLSINRVVGNDPSAIFGTLSSNGRLVLVNPAGIAVGAGAMVDTAGFTASTLRLSEANAIAGRLVFGGDGLGGGALTVDGTIRASGGDVVLIAPNVQVGSPAIVQSPNGATILAAGQKVELTGRGLEGIRLELQAPSDQALNLGTLQGDAVGIFAGQLKHSGLINATATSIEGGKVVLKGVDSADISGRITARKGDQGGQVHATAGKVMLRSGAVIDVSGAQGGGEALIGGGWQGKDSRIANAVETLVEAGATVNADATANGNGGTIVAWSDGATQVYGALSARGGEVSGDGGNVETSGHYLDMQGQVDTRAPNGSTGNLLLDPTNVYIADSQTNATAAGMVGTNLTSTGPTFTPGGTVQDSLVTTNSIQTFLGTNNVLVQTSNATGTGAGFIRVVDGVTWTSGNALGLLADTNIFIAAPISGGAGSTLSLSAGEAGGGGSIAQNASGAGISVSNLYAYTKNVNGGSITLTGTGNTISNIGAFSGTGSISLANNGNLSIANVFSQFGVMGSIAGVTTTGQPITISTSGGSINVSDTSNGVRTPGGTATLSALNGSVTQSAGAKITAGTLSVTAQDSIDLSPGINDVSSFTAAQTGSTGGNIAFVNSTSATQWTLNSVTQNALSPASVSISSAGSQNIQVQGNVVSGASSSLSVSTAGSIIQGVSSTLTGAGITLEADRMILQGAASSVNAGSGAILVKPKTSNWGIDLGSSMDVAANTLELSTNELNTFAGGTLRIGSLTAGNLNISAAIAPASVGTIRLESGGTITQAAAGTITANNLAIRAFGDVDLDTAINSVSNIAADLGNASNLNSHFRLRTGGALNVAGNLDGTSGISIQRDGVGYNAAAQNAYIRLQAGGALTQQMGLGALLGGKAVYAQGTSVQLTEPNPTGVISGTATGTSGTDVFKYTSSNGINVNDVAGGSGVRNDSSLATVAIELTGTNVTQKAGSFITAANGLKLVTSGGPVMLNETGNDVGALSISGANTVNYQDASALTLGLAGFGVSASGAVDIRSAGALTVAENLTGSGVVLKATGLADLSINAAVNAGAGSMTLQAGKDIVLNAATLSGGGTASLSAGSMARVAAGTTTLNTNLGGSQLVVQGTLNVGANVTVDSLSLVSSGTITGPGDLTVGSSFDWSGGSMTGSGDTTIGPGATATISGGVSLMRHLVNASGGSIVLSGSGQITATSPGSFDNSGFFDIQNDGGFAGSAFTINNSGTFTKTAGTGVSAVSGVNFINNGSLAVSSGTLQFGSAGFSSNSGLVLLAAGATLDNSNTTLANTSAGVIKGSGTLKLGTGTLNNSGALMPGGPGTVGTLTIDAATVNLDAGTQVHVDVVSTSSFDMLNVTGNLNLASGVTIVPNTSGATGLLPGDSFDIAFSSLGSVSGTLPVVPGFDINFVSSPAPVVRVALALPPAPAPTPVLLGGSLVDQATAVLDGDKALAQEVIGELSSNPLTTFTALLEKEEEQAADGTGADNVVDNNQCRR